MGNRYKGGSSASQPLLTWHYAAYQPAALMNMDEKQLRKEYTRLRDIAQKRLKRIAASEFSQSDVAKYNAGRYKPLREIESKSELTKLLSDLVRFTTARRGSVAGLRSTRDKAIETLHEHGYDFVNKRNYQQFAEFMEWARASKNAGQYDSDRVAELFRDAQRWQISPEELQNNFDFYASAVSPDEAPPTVGDYRATLTADQLKGKDAKRVTATLKKAKQYKIPAAVLARNFEQYYATAGERAYSKAEYLNALSASMGRRRR